MKTLFQNFVWGENLEPQQMVTIGGIVVDRGPETHATGEFEVQDLGGAHLQPKYIDNHCHILPTGLDLAKLNLIKTTQHDDVLDLLSKRNFDDSEGWLLAVHYDQNRFGGIQITRHQLDAISSTRPILLRHSSGHAGVANSVALQLAGINESVADEPGGAFGRDAIGTLDGVLFENAFERVSRAVPKPTFEEMVAAILRAGSEMSALNICCASDMQTGSFDLYQELLAYREAASKKCKVAMRLYLQWGRVFGPKGIEPDLFKEIVSSFDGVNCRVQGIKLFADGAIGAGTAAIYGSYADHPSDAATSGTLMYKPDVLKQKIVKASQEGWQVSVHAIGDYAADIVMEAFEQADQPSTHRLEHAMLLSDSQIERLQLLDCHVCLQPEFLSRFGKTYAAKLGADRSENLIRFRSMIDANLKISFSSDRPITGGNPELGISIATNRPDGFTSTENCTLAQAKDAYMSSAARATSDDHLFGSLDKGQKSEFFLVSR